VSPDRWRRDHADVLEHADTFAHDRAAAERYPCDPPPHGCAAVVGQTCTAIGNSTILLRRQPAHVCRLRKAGRAAPSTIPTPRPHD
jgi:hypothetical protein